MKYLKQLSLILFISFIAEVLYYVLPLPIPASIYGLLLLFFSLLLGIIKLEQVEDTAEFFLAVMPVFFISPSVSLMEAFVGIESSVVSILIICAVSTLVVTISTGLVAQVMIRAKRKREKVEKE